VSPEAVLQPVDCFRQRRARHLLEHSYDNSLYHNQLGDYADSPFFAASALLKILGRVLLIPQQIVPCCF
jgi:hypothetical protein